MTTDLRLRCRECDTTDTFPNSEAINRSDWAEHSSFGAYKGDGVVEYRSFCSVECEVEHG